MGCSEMGITQTDEYQETYERFMEEYDMGKPVHAIVSDILEDYTEEFGSGSGILHGVYYAIAKCQWMCGGVSGDSMEKVRDIAESGDDLSFYKDLGTEERDLKLRKRNLEKFYQSLLVPRATARRRKKTEEAYVSLPKPKHSPLPQIFAGDLIAYPVGEKVRLFLILNINHNRKQGSTAYCFVWEEAFSQLPETEALMNDRGIPFGRVPAEAFPEQFKVVGRLQMPPNVHSLIGYAYPMWSSYVGSVAARESFYKTFPRQLCLRLDAVIKKVMDIQKGIR